MTRSLVIVESPAKAKTIEKYLGAAYVVESSIGHIRDLALPKDLSKEVKDKNPYIKKFAVDVDGGFRPIYVVSADRKQHITKLRKLVKESDQLLLATDEDREGESIAWHLLEVLKPKVPVKRMVFHEITKKAILEAVEAPRDIDQNLVDAQEARRILDRLYGFAMSGVVQRRSRGQSAGRVQSVATRIVVEREKERQKFVRAKYSSLLGQFINEDAIKLGAGLQRIDGKRVAEGRDFGDNGKLKKDDVALLDPAAVKTLIDELQGQDFVVGKVEKKPFTRRPAAPFMTSTLQQEAGRKFRFGAQRTMRAAQRLYENGYITYMRTDSTTLSETALKAAREAIQKLYSPADLPKAPRQYKRKVKNAQEAHEAIRPAGDSFRHPEQVAREVGPDEAKLYDLIWKRTVASQMADAKGESLIVTINATTTSGKKVAFGVRGNTFVFQGFRKAYVEGSDDPEKELSSKERPLPPLKEGQHLKAESFEAREHETQPPARFTEASLVKKLEELGVGRPSTYASIIGVIQDRGYVWKRGTALVPSFKAFQVVGLLETHFGHLVDYAFTARMEDDLDGIAAGSEKSDRYLGRFFQGEGDYIGLEKLVTEKLESIDLDEIKRLETFPIGTNSAGQNIVVRIGQYGPYVQIEGEKQTASVPDDLPPDELNIDKAEELLAAPSKDRELGQDPETGKMVYVKAGRFGDYVQLGGREEGSKEKPKTGSLLKSMSRDTLTLDEALKILALPRTIGVAEDGEEVVAHNGRYGPYIVKGKENRSLEAEGDLFTIGMTDALALLAKPKTRRGRAAAKPPLRELGNDPVSEKPIVLKEGRFGPYVTDGETNASLRTGDDPKTVTPERAQELLQLRREKVAAGGGRKRKTTKKSAKKSTKKAAKKTAKKTAKKAAKKTTKKAAKKTTKKAAKKTTKKAAKKTTKKAATKAAE